jgi:hypothetical protein
MAKDQTSKTGWLERRREAKRQKDRRAAQRAADQRREQAAADARLGETSVPGPEAGEWPSQMPDRRRR